MKRTYIKPAIQLMKTGTDFSLMAASINSNTLYENKTGTEKDDKGGNEIDAKQHTAWSAWDD